MNSLIKAVRHNPAVSESLKEEVARKHAERNLPAFIEQAWHVTEAGTRYIDNWHIHLIGEYMQAVNSGQIRRLIINMPPRHMKSIEATVCYPAWTWTRNPEKRFIKISYADTLSRKHNVLTRDIICSPWFRKNWGEVFALKDDVNRQNEFKNTKNGFMFSTSVGGSLTGEGGDVIIIDDPQDPDAANSEAERNSTVAFFRNKLLTRLNDPQKGAIIIIMQRLHENDLTGHILTEGLNYEHLCLPALAPERTIVNFPVSGKKIIREEGDMLNPKRFNKEVLDDLKRSMGSVQFAGQFQQTPVPDEGIIFKREWLNKRYRELPAGAQIIQSWDLPFKNSEASAKCAGIVMARKGAELFFVDCVNDKMSFTDSVAAIKSLTAKHPRARAKVVEDKANGPAIISFLQKDIPGMIPFNPKGSKEDRALSVAPYFEAGNVYFPDGAHWVSDLTTDLRSFPNGRFKDTVDATVQAILYFMDKPISSLGDTDKALGKESYWRK
jgi:predicted phage terminase large subunit-like protein